MANPSNSIPPRVGFPQAFGNNPYQPVAQFSQYQNVPSGHAGHAAPPPPQQNGGFQPMNYPLPGAPAALPQPSGFSPAPPGPGQQMYAPPPQLGQSSNVPSPVPSAFKPYSDQQTSSSMKPLVQPNGLPPAPQLGPQLPAVRLASQPVVSQQPQSFNGHHTQPFPTPPGSGMNGPKPQFPVPSLAPQNPPMMNAPPMPGQFPAPGWQQPGPGGMGMAQPPQMPLPQVHNPNQQYGGNVVQPQRFPGPTQQAPQQNVPQMQPNHQQPQWGGQQPQVAQMQHQMGQMSMGQPSWGGGQAAGSAVVDLLAERNLLQHGFEDVPYQLPENMANNQARVDPGVFRCTVNAVPQTEEILKKSRLPFGLTLHPFRDMKELNIIQTSTIVRCRFCRTYINPFVFMPDSRRWKCNLCNRVNDLPDDFCWDMHTKSFGEPTNRPEIRYATVEFIAPSDYMPVRKNRLGNNELRPPQPAVYVYVFDVSSAAVESGYLYTLCEQIIINLDQIPGDDRAQIAFVAVDESLHFFQFPASGRSPPRQLVIDDFNDAFLPVNTGILVPLKKNGDMIRSFLQQLPMIFEKPMSSNNCLGAALQIVKELIGDIGGRVTVFQASLPNIGPGALQSREDPNQRASSDVQNMGPATDFYKRLALECTGMQVALDLFVVNSQYADIASLSEIAKFSTGNIYHFPNYHYINDPIQVKRFEKTVSRYLIRKIGFEAVLRIRCSRGLTLSAFFGNFFVRSTDLMALANVNPDAAIAVQVGLEEKLGPTVAFQAALLYTSSKGDRRIRVHTMCLPTTTDLAKVYASFDLKAAVSLLAKLGVDRSMTGSPLSDSREAMVNAVVDTLGAFNRTIGQNKQAILAPREGHLKFFPLYALAMLKHTSLCSGRSVRLDDRVASMLMLRFSPLEQILSEFYPQLYRLNEILQYSEGEWPRALPLSFEHVHRDGVYALEAGSAFYVYVSSGADGNFLQDLFGCQYNEVDENSMNDLDKRRNPLAERVHAFFRHVTSLKFYLGPIVVIREDSPRREMFVRRLIEDRSESTHSYIEFLQHVKRELSQ